MCVYMCVCVHACGCVRACVRACVRGEVLPRSHNVQYWSLVPKNLESFQCLRCFHWRPRACIDTGMGVLKCILNGLLGQSVGEGIGEWFPYQCILLDVYSAM